MRLILLILSSVLWVTANAEMKQWVDENGITYYGSKPAYSYHMQSTNNTFNNWRNSYPKKNQSHASKNKPAISSRVDIYTTSSCSYCKQAKRYFNEEGIRYTEHNIEKSSKAARNFRKLKGSKVPLILVGKKRMNGFSQKRFERLFR